MRSLSKIEKDIIIQLVNQPTTLENLLGNINKDLVLLVKKTEKQVALIKVTSKEGDKTDIANEFARFWLQRLLFISTLIKLLYYLEQNGYIISHLLTFEDDQPYYLGKLREKVNLQEISTPDNMYYFDDEFLIDQITKYSFRIIYATEELKLYYHNGFKTPEELRFKKSYTLAKTAIAISLIIGLLGFSISIINLRRPTKLDGYQYNEFIRHLDSLHLRNYSDAISLDTLVNQDSNGFFQDTIRNPAK